MTPPHREGPPWLPDLRDSQAVGSREHTDQSSASAVIISTQCFFLRIRPENRLILTPL